MGGFADLIYFAELDEFGGHFFLFDMDDSLGSSGVAGRGALAIALASDTRQDSGRLDALGEASQNTEVVLIGALDHFNIDHSLHCES